MTSPADIRNGTCLLTLAGEFDRVNVGGLAAEIEGCLKETSSSILLDFGSVTFVDGAVLSLLHSVLARLGNRGWLGVARPLPWIERVFGVVGLVDLPGFRIFSTMEDALEVIDRG